LLPKTNLKTLKQSTLALLLVVFSLAPIAAIAEVVVYVAFNEPLRHTISYDNGFLDQVECNQAADSVINIAPESQVAILDRLTTAYNQAGVADIRFTSTPTADPDVSVLIDNRFTAGPEGVLLVECTGLDLDRFNRQRGEEVLVNLAILNNGDTDVEAAAQLIAHEVGHAFGLRHAFAPSDLRSVPLGIMRPGGFDGVRASCRDNCVFLNNVSPISEKPNVILGLIGFDVDPFERLQSTNAIYHLRRYVAEQPTAAIESAGVCPGDWDISLFEQQPTLLRLELAPGAQRQQDALHPATKTPIALYDVRVHEWYGNDLPRVLYRAEATTLEALLQQRYVLASDSLFELMASSSPGGAPDIALVKFAQDGELVAGFDLIQSGGEVSLSRFDSPESYAELAALRAIVKTDALFADRFQSVSSIGVSPLRDPMPEKDLSACPSVLTPLNDTGIRIGGDLPNITNSDCSGTNITMQDCAQGRDAYQTNDADGIAGFNFSKIATDGSDLPSTAGDWACVRDNVTGLMWEVKTNDGGLRDGGHTYAWFDPDNPMEDGSCVGVTCNTASYVEAVNNLAEPLCGARDWRIPRQWELRSLVYYGDRPERFSDDKALFDPRYFPYQYRSSDVQFVWANAGKPPGTRSGQWCLQLANGFETRCGFPSGIRLLRGGGE
jgi:hypothetical protein